MQHANKELDIIENTIRRHDDILEILLLDRTRTNVKKTHNIVWGTNSYKKYKLQDEIGVGDITGENTFLIQPRIAKSKEEQRMRTSDKAEVFTPRAIVAEMNKLVDWTSKNWPTTKENWQKYVAENRLEITCGEAPFMVGRYNAVNGMKVLKLEDRVGFLDTKLREVSKYCDSKEEWLKWAKIAFQSSYGYEWQGDNIILARENLFYTFIDYWNDKFENDKIYLYRQVSAEKMEILKEIATIISWNIFQMDGLKYVVPMSCKHEIVTEDVPPLLLALGTKPTITKNICPGCAASDPNRHNGTYVKIMDWKKNKTIKFVDLIK